MTRPLAALALGLTLSGCAHTAPPAPQQAFWDALASHCGAAYAGRVASNDARDADWMGKRMVAHWAECRDDRIAIAFHVEDAAAPGGWNRSRTWLVTRGADGLTLKHDHRHADGEADSMTFYGGSTADEGSAGAQDFPVDAQSIALFTRDGLDVSLTNVWRMEVSPRGADDARFTYQLTRRNDPTRLFRVEFDATRPIPAPPPAWGW